MAQLRLPVWAVIWVVVSTIIVFADAAFVLLRPHSMAKGIYSHFPLWNMYPLYYSIDKLYADMDNAFVKAQTVMNLFENVGNIVGLLWWATSRSPRAFILLMLSVTATFCKTVLYMLHEHCSPEHSHPTAHNFPDNVQNYLLLYILPNSLWLLFPFAVIRNMSSQLAAAVESAPVTKLKSK